MDKLDETVPKVLKYMMPVEGMGHFDFDSTYKTYNFTKKRVRVLR